MKVSPTNGNIVLDSVQDAKLRQVSRQFETLLTNQMLSSMRKTVQKQGFVKESNAEKIYESMLDYEYATKLSDTDSLGLSDMIYKYLKETSTR